MRLSEGRKTVLSSRLSVRALAETAVGLTLIFSSLFIFFLIPHWRFRFYFVRLLGKKSPAVNALGCNCVVEQVHPRESGMGAC